MTDADARTEQQDERTQTEPVSDDFDAEVPAAPPSDVPEDWPDVHDEEALRDEPVGPAMGERVAQIHAERPWLLPGIAVAAVVVVVSALVLRRVR